MLNLHTHASNTKYLYQVHLKSNNQFAIISFAICNSGGVEKLKSANSFILRRSIAYDDGN